MAIPESPMSEIHPLDVVAVAPHPDDLEILCGGTLAKLVKQGYRVGMFDLTTGEPTPRGSLEIRAREAEAARQALGVPLRVNVGLPNRVLMDSPENRFALATQFRKYRPEIVIAAAGRTPAASPDHYQGQLLIEASRFYSQLTKWDERFGGLPPFRVPHLVYAPFPFDAEVRQWAGSFIVDISDTFEPKVQAIRCYESQFDGDRFEKLYHYLSAQNAATGGRCGFRYGEQFYMPVPVGSNDLATTVKSGKGSPAPVQLPGKDHLPFG
jgi:bacillithiol biosynthesis deacetylase BshB1